MAKMSIRLKSTRRWWVMPLVNCSAFTFAAAGRDQFPDRFVEWLAAHGFKIEVVDE